MRMRMCVCVYIDLFACLTFVVVAAFSLKRKRILLHLFAQFTMRNKMKLIQIAMGSLLFHFILQWMRKKISFELIRLFSVCPNAIWAKYFALNAIKYSVRILPPSCDHFHIVFSYRLFFVDGLSLSFSTSNCCIFVLFLIFKLKTYKHKMI